MTAIRLAVLDDGNVDVWCDACTVGLGQLAVEFTYDELRKLVDDHQAVIHHSPRLVRKWCNWCGGDRLVCRPLPRGSDA